MSIRNFKPTSAGIRSMSVSTFEEITQTEPEKSLTVSLKRKGGRNNLGRVTVRHQEAATGGCAGSSTSSATRSAYPARS